MLHEAGTALSSYLISQAQHYIMNTLMNMRYPIQTLLEPWVGRNRAKKWAIALIMLLEGPIKAVLYHAARSNT